MCNWKGEMVGAVVAPVGLGRVVMAERGRDRRGGKRFWGSLYEWRETGEESTEDGPELELNGS